MQYQSSFTQFMAGGVAGVAYWGCIYPLDIVKVSGSSVFSSVVYSSSG